MQDSNNNNQDNNQEIKLKFEFKMTNEDIPKLTFKANKNIELLGNVIMSQTEKELNIESLSKDNTMGGLVKRGWLNEESCKEIGKFFTAHTQTATDTQKEQMESIKKQLEEAKKKLKSNKKLKGNGKSLTAAELTQMEQKFKNIETLTKSIDNVIGDRKMSKAIKQAQGFMGKISSVMKFSTGNNKPQPLTVQKTQVNGQNMPRN